MPEMTITEALAEIKLINNKIAKKREFVIKHLARTNGMRDPLESDGGSPSVLSSEIQAIGDLSNRIVAIRGAIWEKNMKTTVDVCGIKKTIAEWLSWRREVSGGSAAFLKDIIGHIGKIRDEGRKRAVTVCGPNDSPSKTEDIVVHLNEVQIQREDEKLSDILERLDGMLSLKNATVTVEV